MFASMSNKIEKCIAEKKNQINSLTHYKVEGVRVSANRLVIGRPGVNRALSCQNLSIVLGFSRKNFICAFSLFSFMK